MSQSNKVKAENIGLNPIEIYWKHKYSVVIRREVAEEYPELAERTNKEWNEMMSMNHVERAERSTRAIHEMNQKVEERAKERFAEALPNISEEEKKELEDMALADRHAHWTILRGQGLLDENEESLAQKKKYEEEQGNQQQVNEGKHHESEKQEENITKNEDAPAVNEDE